MTTIPPKIGHARLKETYAGLEIQLPMKGKSFAVGFLCFWLFFWVIGEITAVRSLKDPGYNDFPMQSWLIGWTLGGIAAISMLIGALTLKEVITIEPGKLQLKRNIPFRKPEVYDLQQANNFRAQQESRELPSGMIRNLERFQVNKGSIHFEYGMQNVQFAWGLDQMKASWLLHVLLQKDLLRKEQLLPGVSY